MMIFRLLFWIVLFYLAYQVIRLLLKGAQREQDRVQGRTKKQPLDLSKMDVEDAKFEEVKKK